MRPIQVRLVGRFRFSSRLGGQHEHLLYRGQHTQTNDQLFLKGEEYRCRPSEGFLTILQQGKILQIMQGGIGIPHMHWCGQEEDYNFIVLEYLDKSLQSLQTLCGGVFSTKTALMLAQQLLSIVQYFHFKLFIHNQICSKNILLGQGDKFGKFYLVDYCGASRYKDSQSLEHIPADRKVQPRLLNLQFSSLRYNNGEAVSRRDDIESLLYLVLFWLKGKLPWSDIVHSNKKTQTEKIRLVLKMKVQLSDEELFEGYPELLMLYRHTRKLQFDQKPRYTYYQNVFKQKIQQNGLLDDKIYDWMLIQQPPLPEDPEIDFDVIPNQAQFIRQITQELKLKEKLQNQKDQEKLNLQAVSQLKSPRSKLKEKECLIY